MNPTELLPRFASASEWLAEEHPDAPMLPGWIYIGDPANNSCVAEFVDNELDSNIEVYNPDACLAGAVVWAMEVAGWWSDGDRNGRIYRCYKDSSEIRVWLWYLRCDEPQLVLYGETDTPAAAWLLVLESVCTALGREG